MSRIEADAGNLSAAPAGAAEAPNAHGENALETRGVRREFRGKAAVDGVDLCVRCGETYGLIGLNGAGKSTLLRMLVGLLRPSAGICLVNGVDAWAEPVRARTGMGFVPDRPAAYAWMRVSEVITFCKRLQPRWNDALVAALLKQSRIDPRARVRNLSKGTGAKLSLLLALGHDPDVLILDEPTDGLDPIAHDDFVELVLNSVCDRPRTVLLSSHSMADVQRITDRVGLMHEGRLLVQCPTDELVATTKRIRAVLNGGGAPAAPPGAVWSRIDGREWMVTVRGSTDAAVEQIRAAGARNVEIIDVNLDDVFKDMVRGACARKEQEVGACS